MTKPAGKFVSFISFLLGVYTLYTIFMSDNPDQRIANLFFWSGIIGALNALYGIIQLFTNPHMFGEMDLPKETTKEGAKVAHAFRNVIIFISLLFALLFSTVFAVIGYFAGHSL